MFEFFHANPSLPLSLDSVIYSCGADGIVCSFRIIDHGADSDLPVTVQDLKRCEDAHEQAVNCLAVSPDVELELSACRGSCIEKICACVILCAYV